MSVDVEGLTRRARTDHLGSNATRRRTGDPPQASEAIRTQCVCEGGTGGGGRGPSLYYEVFKERAAPTRTFQGESSIAEGDNAKSRSSRVLQGLLIVTECVLTEEVIFL